MITKKSSLFNLKKTKEKGEIATLRRVSIALVNYFEL